MSDKDKEVHKEKRTYKVQIDKAHFELENATPTARELLVIAGKQPPESFALYFKPHGGAPVRIALGEKADLREPGVERFVTLPLDQTEGLGEGRREFDLPADDAEWLDACGMTYELVHDGTVPRVVLHGFPVPAGYNVESVSVNVRIETGYPDAQIDMAYFFPALARVDGRPIGALCQDQFDGKSWQRWSRHRTGANPWRPGIDNLSTHFALVENWLQREIVKA